ncbi:MAG: hypothetical protein R2867_36845 [Caldilineaceae bacterium]
MAEGTTADEEATADETILPLSAVETISLEVGRVNGLAVAPDGERLAAATDSGLWLGSRGEAGTLYATTAPLTSVSWSPDGPMLATTAGVQEAGEQEATQGLVLIWNSEDGTVLTIFDNLAAPALAVQWSPRTVPRSRRGAG